MTMHPAANICAICAWRANCRKKFSVSGRDTRCPDFSEDVSLRKGKRVGGEEAAKKEEHKPQKPKPRL